MSENDVEAVIQNAIFYIFGRQVMAGCCLIILDIYLIIRNRTGIAQDKLGVMIGMDESCSSARMSRYETGIHEPPIAIAGKIAHALNLPLM